MNDDMGAPQSLLPAKSNGPASDGLETEIRVIRESGLFDEAYYRANNPKLAPSVDPVRHFLERGAGAGRQPNRMFDPAFYLGQNPDVAQSGDNPLVHFIHYGAAEGRRPHRDFDPAFYLARYPDLVRAGQNPLLHYLLWGEKEGRKPNAQEVGSAVAVTHAEIQCLKQPSFRDEVALFLAHSPHGHLKPHVRHYLDCLKRQGIAVILIVHADGPFIATRIDKINGLDGMFVRRNEGYDFAAWAHILRLHPELYDAKILYLLNDSVIGPMSDASFGAMLTRLRNSPAGLIGLTDNIVRDWHIQSYFLALKRPALSSIALRKFISDIVSYEDLEDVIDNFEVRLAPTLKAAGVDAAIATAKQVQEQDRDFQQARALIGDVYMAANRPADAVRAYQDALATAPSEMLVGRLNAALLRSGQSDAAIKVLSDWIAQHPAEIGYFGYIAAFAHLTGNPVPTKVVSWGSIKANYK